MRSVIVILFFSVALFYSFLCINTKVPDRTSGVPVKDDSLQCDAPIKSGLLKDKIKGMSFVAPPNSFDTNPILELDELGVDWIAALPYSFFRKNKASIHTLGQAGWWGERSEGICRTIHLAHEKGIKVMLKPQLWTHDQWIGDLDFDNEKDWRTFEKSYSDFILSWAVLADTMEVELFCIGTEIRHSTRKFPEYWSNLIDEIRKVYDGKLTYASNWDHYEKVTFWDKLDFIGTDAYFPLLSDKTPTVCKLKTAWKPFLNKLKIFAETYNKPVLFTEYGYLSLDGCAYKTWELEKKRESVAVNQKAQANAIQALLETFAENDFWAGGFLWKWYSDINSAMGEGARNRDYTPQGKKAQKVLKIMYQN